MKKNLIRILSMALALIMLMGVLAGCGSDSVGVSVQRADQLALAGRAGERYAGVVVSENVVEITRDSSKRVEELYVEVGQEVTAGDKLFSYDTDELELALEKAQLEVEKMTNELADYRQQQEKLERTMDKLRERYGRDMEENRYWAEFDFGKPGMPYTSLQSDKMDAPIPKCLAANDNTLTLFLRGPEEACEKGGCPRDIRIQYRFAENEIHMTIFLLNKDAMRAPEALWVHMNPKASDSWLLRKMGRLLSPTHILSGGNRQMHAVEGLVLPGVLEIRNLDAPLVSMGRPNLYAVDEIIEEYNAVTREQLRKLAGEMFDWNKASMSAVGKVKTIADYSKWLGR